MDKDLEGETQQSPIVRSPIGKESALIVRQTAAIPGMWNRAPPRLGRPHNSFDLSAKMRYIATTFPPHISRGGVCAPLFLLLFLLVLGGISIVAVSPQDQSLPTKIEITQHSDPHDAWDKGTTAVQNLAWPLMVLFTLYLFRPSIARIVEQFGKSGGEISIAGLGIKLPTAKGVSMSEDVLSFKVADSPVSLTAAPGRRL